MKVVRGYVVNAERTNSNPDPTKSVIEAAKVQGDDGNTYTIGHRGSIPTQITVGKRVEMDVDDRGEAVRVRELPN